MTIAMQTTVVDGVTKYTMAFPLTDEAGNPILDRHGKPRFTNIVGDSPEDVAVKLAQANVEVARALDRTNRHIDTLKNKRPTPQRPAADLKPKPLTADEQIQVGLDMQDPRKAAAAVEKVVESRIAPVAGELERQGQTLDIEARKRIAREFIATHRDDYYAIEANGVLMNQYLARNGYEYSLENLEIAFAALEGQLARKPVPRNAPAATPASEPVNAAPDNAAPNREMPPTPQRRPPVSGISNAQVSGRPGMEVRLTREQALHMLYKEPQKYEAWMHDPVKNAILTQALSGR